MEQGGNGAVVNAKTGAPFAYDDPCIEHGPQVAYNAAATEATEKSLKEFLATAFKGR